MAESHVPLAKECEFMHALLNANHMEDKGYR